MRRSWDSYPISAVLEGMAAAFSGALGFVVAVIIGVVLGFAAHGAALSDTHDGFFVMYLVTFFPLGLLQHLINASGIITALGAIVLTALFFTSDRFKPEALLGLCLSIGLYTFQAIGLTGEMEHNAWLRFAGIVLCSVAMLVGVRVLAVMGKNRKNRRKANNSSDATSEPSAHQG